ncbi:MAG: hypothetical protein AAGD10_21970 [Myxococcota bacterium]
MRGAFPLLLCLGLAGCGGSNADEIVGLGSQTRFLANQPFILTVLVQSPPSCAEIRFDEAECDVDIDEDARIIRVNAKVPFEESDGCVPDTGLESLPVDCAIDALPPGTYTVRSGGSQPFQAPIELF